MAAEREVVSTYDVKRLCIVGELSRAICEVDSLRGRGITISVSILFFLLQGCVQKRNLTAGRRVYSLIIRNGFGMDTFLGCHLVRMFSLCGSLLEAEQTFFNLPKHDSCTWSAIILAHAKFGCAECALKLYNEMHEFEVEPADYTFNAALQACSTLGAFSEGKSIHFHIVECGLESDTCLGNTLINMYAKCGSLDDAHSVFDHMSKPGIVAWCSIISGYADQCEGLKAFQLLTKMHEGSLQPNLVTFISILKACSSMACVMAGKLVHALIIENNCALNLKALNVLIDMYGKSGDIEDADFISCRMFERSVVTWSTLISIHADHGLDQVALQLFQHMQHEGVESDCATFAGVLKASSTIYIGKSMHVLLLEKGSSLDDLIGSILIEMYFRLLCSSDAYNVFRILPRCKVHPWNAMITGSLQGEQFEDAMSHFQSMLVESVAPDITTYSSIVKACSDNGQVAQGELLFSLILETNNEKNDVIGNALVSMYVKCGSLVDAYRLFDRLSNPDTVAWSAMIAGYVLHGFGHKALKLYCHMQLDGKEPDNVTFLSILKACSLLSALNQGRLIHAQVTVSKWESDVQLGNSLIDMYSKCGSLHDALIVFHKLREKTSTTWNALIVGLAHHNKYHLALQLFKVMQQEGLKPNDATFSSLLSACNRLGLVHEGHLVFESLSINYSPKADHYVCLVELFSHAGSLNDAVDLVSILPFAPDLITMTSLLNNSKAYGGLELGKQIFNSLMTIDGDYASGYAIMSNFFADANLPEDANNMQMLRNHANAWKKPGEAFIEVDNEVYSFAVHDQSQQKGGSLSMKLHSLHGCLRKGDHVPSLDLVLRDSCQ